MKTNGTGEDNAPMDESNTGKIGWIDLTVKDAASLKTFYQSGVGWTVEPVEMGGYSDYCMQPPGADNPVAGICHARGNNADLPTQWLIYITVKDLEESLRQCQEAKGQVLTPIKPVGEGRYAVIRDPAGAVCALYQNRNCRAEATTVQMGLAGGRLPGPTTTYQRLPGPTERLPEGRGSKAES